MRKIRAELSTAFPGLLLWRNNCGVDLTRGVRYGLGVGGADLVGVHLGRFVAIEVKRPGKTLRPEQKIWGDAVTRAGGIFFRSDSAAHARETLTSLLK